MPLRVIVAIDALYTRRTLGRILGAAGLTVVAEAENGAQAFSCYQQLWPDLVVMDVAMPLMDGVTALKQILVLDREAIVVMCATEGQREMSERALEAGAKANILKPFRPEQVAETVRRVMGITT